MTAQQILMAVGAPATVTNLFVVWDTATASNVTFSGGNLITTSTGGSTDHGAHVAAASGKTTGKYCFETTLTTFAGGGDTGVGVGTPTSTYAGMGNNATTGTEVYSSGNLWTNGGAAGVSIGSGLATGNIIGMAVDLDNRKMWFRFSPSGNWNNNSSNNPATNVGGVTIPAGTIVPFCNFSASGNVWATNFGNSAFSGAVPSGFTAGWPL